VRRGNEWLFASFEGVVHPVDVGGDVIRVGDTWSLVDDTDRRANWRIGGAQHLAVHAASGRLYALMHQGGRDTHKEAGTEAWVYDVASHRRLQRIKLPNPLASFVGQELAAEGRPRTARATAWLLGHTLPSPGIERILVTQDEHPLLIASAS